MTSSSVPIFISNSLYISELKLYRQPLNLPKNSYTIRIVSESNYFLFFLPSKISLPVTRVFEMFGALPLMNTWHAEFYGCTDSSLSKFIGMYAVWFDKLFCFAFHQSHDIERTLPVYLRHHLSKIRLRGEQIKRSKNLLNW